MHAKIRVCVAQNFMLGIPTCWYLKTLKFALAPTRILKFALPRTRNPKTSQWNPQRKFFAGLYAGFTCYSFAQSILFMLTIPTCWYLKVQAVPSCCVWVGFALVLYWLYSQNKLLCIICTNLSPVNEICFILLKLCLPCKSTKMCTLSN